MKTVMSVDTKTIGYSRMDMNDEKRRKNERVFSELVKAKNAHARARRQNCGLGNQEFKKKKRHKNQ